MRTLAVALTAMLAYVSIAHAQETIVAADPGFVDFLTKYLDIAVTALIPVIAIPLVLKGFSLIGVKLDRAKSDELQVAFTNAASALIQEMGEDAKTLRINARDPRVAAAVRRVQARVPDYLRWAGLDEQALGTRTAEVIAGRILEKVPQIAPTSIATPLPPIADVDRIDA